MCIHKPRLLSCYKHDVLLCFLKSWIIAVSANKFILSYHLILSYLTHTVNVLSFMCVEVLRIFERVVCFFFVSCRVVLWFTTINVSASLHVTPLSVCCNVGRMAVRVTEEAGIIEVRLLLPTETHRIRRLAPWNYAMIGLDRLHPEAMRLLHERILVALSCIGSYNTRQHYTSIPKQSYLKCAVRCDLSDIYLAWKW